jgi:hypothetical protein
MVGKTISFIIKKIAIANPIILIRKKFNIRAPAGKT